MALNKVQRDFVNATARRHLETMIASIDAMDTFQADYDALQASADALPEDATTLDDNSDGTAPRDDAPQLTGAQLKLLRDKSAAMSAVLTEGEKQALIGKLVRSLAVVRRIL